MALFGFVLGGGKIDKALQIPALGLAINFSRTTVLEWGLAVVCLYAAARYGYHAFVKSLTPWKARKLLEGGQYGPVPVSNVNQGPETRAIAARYVPGFEAQVSVVKRLGGGDGYIGASGAGMYPTKVRVWIILDNLDYTAPIWIAALAILAFVVAHIFGL